MKYCLISCCLFLIGLSAFSASYKTQIHSIDWGKEEEPHLVMLNNGHVAFLEKKSDKLIKSVNALAQIGQTVVVVLDEKLNLISIKGVSEQKVFWPDKELLSPDDVAYNPSVIGSGTASRVFSSMRRDYQYESQCYNRAHIWAYEEYRRSGLRSSKLFIFFTSRYIRNYRYKWWFHVTPMVNVGTSGQSGWRALDRRYTGSPLTVRTWTNVFMHNNAYCPVVYNWSSYRNHQQERDCYLIPTSMYFWQPRDIVTQERNGYVKKQFFSGEISHAYWEAF